MGPGRVLLGCLWLLALRGGRGEPWPSALPDADTDTAQEAGYYLQQLFRLYGTNGTLPSSGLARLLGSLGLGRVQVVQIQHEELGHGHVSHLDLLEPRGCPWGRRGPRPTPVGAARPQPAGEAAHRWVLHPPPPPSTPQCLNVTQLLVNFGLASVSQLTPEQFTLLCPALLYQIDSRVCIQHRDEVTLPPPGGGLWPALGWGLLAVTFVSLPSALAVGFVPLLSRGFFRSLLAFLVALAVGTLCGDALLHLWPHVGTPPLGWHGACGPGRGLAVLGGIYLLFVVELLLGMLRRGREATVRATGAEKGTGLQPRPGFAPDTSALPPAMPPRRDPRCGHRGPGPVSRR
uniref:Solute carrier family 39 member 5 n=1 Tax=Anas platyrhynchos TaxID=8839 RepID=A0A8B9ZHG9_ANAPL